MFATSTVPVSSNTSVPSITSSVPVSSNTYDPTTTYTAPVSSNTSVPTITSSVPVSSVSFIPPFNELGTRLSLRGDSVAPFLPLLISRLIAPPLVQPVVLQCISRNRLAVPDGDAKERRTISERLRPSFRHVTETNSRFEDFVRCLACSHHLPHLVTPNNTTSSLLQLLSLLSQGTTKLHFKDLEQLLCSLERFYPISQDTPSTSLAMRLRTLINGYNTGRELSDTLGSTLQETLNGILASGLTRIIQTSSSTSPDPITPTSSTISNIAASSTPPLPGILKTGAGIYDKLVSQIRSNIRGVTRIQWLFSSSLNSDTQDRGPGAGFSVSLQVEICIYVFDWFYEDMLLS